MWSFTQERMLSSLEEATNPERAKKRRQWEFYNILYYSCCFLKDPYQVNTGERESIITCSHNNH